MTPDAAGGTGSTFVTEREALRVSCYAGHRGEETPRRLIFGPRSVEVVEVIDRWMAPDHRYFKCRGSDGDIYIVRHDRIRDRWELTMFQRGRDEHRSRSADT